MECLFSAGKLLLTSEYMVLDGALALAIPTKLGQELYVEETEYEAEGILFWETSYQEKKDLNIIIDYKKWEIVETNLSEKASFILKVLQNVQKLSSTKFKDNRNYYLKSNVQFPANYGLGSSSTLMSNLSKWADVDAFLLNEISLGGSGYDIAVALSNTPIIYQLEDNQRYMETVEFCPIFKEQLIFIHLNQKQDSREGIRLFKQKERSNSFVQYFSEITKAVLKANDLTTFSELLTEHELTLSKFLELPTVKDLYFSDCPSFVKSLGAWGGDFVMSSKFERYQEYFIQRGFSTIYDFEELIRIDNQ